TNSSVFPSYQLIRYGDVDVAFIGFTTTSTPVTTSPFTYQDGEGNTIYDFSKENFYQCAQRQIDAARAEGADYVIALSHLGDIKEDDHPTSLNLIAQTKGLDVVLDGHSHSVIPDTLVLNCEGQTVLLSSTGTKFQYIGLLTIDTDGKLTCRLSSPLSEDKVTKSLIDEIQENVIESGTQVIATNGVHLVAEDVEGNRLVRSQEMPIGNLCADAFRKVLNTDVALINGGGIRANLPTGELTYNHLLAIFPFGNVACTATLTGQQLADVLECSVRLLPKENGSFMQVSGLRFEVDSSVPSPVEFDEDNLFTCVKDAPRRVSNISIKERECDDYKPIDLKRIYTLAGIDYHLKEMGSEGILRYATLKEDNQGSDVEVLATYIEQTLNGCIGQSYEQAEGRITIK
ncbi:MAG: bifunctional metallophosphatase/5'-nucleotidase, partial [Bacteroidaceae bacterium]|nr:bifunctional metallophosphatase/5'-nucleotidase [Bacteroidaceae bacterium]